MSRLPLAARGYLLGVMVCAAALLWQLNPLSAPMPSAGMLSLCLVMGAVLVWADTHMIELTHTTKLSASTAVEFALLLMAGPSLAVWTILASVMVTARWHLGRAWKWYNIAFYAANTILSVGIAGVIYQGVSGEAPLLGSGQSVLAVVLAAVIYFVLNVSIVAGMVVLAHKSDSLPHFLSAFQAATPQFAALLTLGVVAAAVYHASALTAALLILPLVAVYASMRSLLTLRAETEVALEALATEVDHYHPYTAQHSARVARYSVLICHALKLGDEQTEMIGQAARIHDVGKLSIWLGMLNKPSGLSSEEMAVLQTHSARGADLVSRFPDYRNGRDLILHHHERYDGKGYPSGLKGDEIPWGRGSSPWRTPPTPCVPTAPTARR